MVVVQPEFQKQGIHVLELIRQIKILAFQSEVMERESELRRVMIQMQCPVMVAQVLDKLNQDTLVQVARLQLQIPESILAETADL